ncbi:MAG TPA: hypothetical protein VML96_01615 [Egibacteraceae bacterium]|nr:hypothetical protein [Egibacteraceae bacterium]
MISVSQEHVAGIRAELRSGESGFSTAELLGNAALGIAALVAVWALLEALGVQVVAWITAQIVGG